MRLIGDKRLNAVRLTLFVGGITWESTSSDECSTLALDDAEFTQPQAMLRYAGRLTGSYPAKSPAAALRVDEILHALSEVEEKMEFVEIATDNEGLRREELVISTIPRYAKLIETRLGRLTDSPVISSYRGKLLVHEIALNCWLKAATEMGFKMDAEAHKHINDAVSRVEDHPRVKQWNDIENVGGFRKLKLTYFPFPGRAEPIRLALFIGGIEFEDERISAEELNRRRASLPFNQLPVLEVDGEVISQALAILRYVGTLSDLYSPSNSMEAFRIDEVFSLVDEFYSSYTWNASYYEKDPVKQKELRRTLAEDTLPKTLGFLERRVTQWGCPHSVAARLTVADLAIYSLLWTFQSGRIVGVPVAVVSPYKNLLRIYQSVSNHPKVVEWSAMPH